MTSPVQQIKQLLVDDLGLAKDALHIYVALGLFLGSAAVFRWPLKSWRPWLVVLAAALAGEAWDLRDSILYDPPIRLGENWHDIWNTMFWPTVLLLLARFTTVFQRS